MQDSDPALTGYVLIGIGALCFGFAAVARSMTALGLGLFLACIGILMAWIGPEVKEAADRVREYKAEQADKAGPVRCPRCGSTSVQAVKRGFRTGRAAAGLLLAGPFGALIGGGLGSGRIEVVCLACGKRFRPGR